MTKIISLLIMGVIALWVTRGYSSFIDRRLGQMRGILSLMKHMEEGISRTLGFGGDLYRDFSDKYLEDAGLLPLLREGVSPTEALSSDSVSLSLDSNWTDEVRSFFSDFGRGYLENEIRRVSDLRVRLSSEFETGSVLLEKNKKIASALIFGGWASIAILLV